MLTTTLSDFRKDIKTYLDKVTQSFETLIINRGKDTGVVVISLEEYNSLKTTQHELSSRINQQRLDESIEALKAGKKLVKNWPTNEICFHRAGLGGLFILAKKRETKIEAYQ